MTDDTTAVELANISSEIDRLTAAMQRRLRSAPACRYCRHPLTDDQERRWGICGSCYDDGTRNDG